MSELAINMVPIMMFAGKATTMLLRAVVAVILGAWAIYWARAIYRTVLKK